MNRTRVLSIIVAVLLIVVAYFMLTQPDNRGPLEKAGDAIGRLDEGVDDAARELEDRTPAERIQDGVEDATDGSPQ